LKAIFLENFHLLAEVLTGSVKYLRVETRFGIWDWDSKRLLHGRH
jgi:hypothetical protein